MNEAILSSLERRKQCLEHDYMISGWALLLVPDIFDDVAIMLNGENIGEFIMTIERIVLVLHLPFPK